MKIFLDTCSLFKLYHHEAGSDDLQRLFSSLAISAIFLSDLTKIEFTSTIWKKVRTREITEIQAQTTLALFETDFDKYGFIVTDSLVIEQARLLVSKYGKKGLRTLDSIQLSTAISLREQVGLFCTADKLLLFCFEAENLPIALPL
jgi:uncharacterized protein